MDARAARRRRRPASSRTSTSSSDSIRHDWVADLEIGLQAPDGTTVMLADNAGGSGRDFTGTILDDEASVSIATADRGQCARSRAAGDRRSHCRRSTASRSPAPGTCACATSRRRTPGSSTRSRCCCRSATSRRRPRCRQARRCPSAGQPTLLDASGSSDRDDAITEYRWDFNGDGTIDQVTSTPQATTTFGAPGHRRVFGHRRRRARPDRQPRPHSPGAPALGGCRRRRPRCRRRP